MKADLQQDLRALRRLAYHRVEKVGALLEEIHAIRKSHPEHPARGVAEGIRRWLLTPFTLWPVDFVGIGKHVVAAVRGEEPLHPEVEFLVEQVADFPNPNARHTVARHERRVEKGEYEGVVSPEARLKYREKVKAVSDDPKFREEWGTLQRLFDLAKFRDEKGIIRRRMVQERNFRPDWDFEAGNEQGRFQTVFDAFCHRWNLYGMEGDEPLVLKLSVNLTAHGTMIVVPAFWSFDWKRDLDWAEIGKLHKARVAKRQGPALSPSRLERMRLAKKTKRLWDRLRRQGYRGAELYRRVKEGLGVAAGFTDREIRRLKKEAGA